MKRLIAAVAIAFTLVGCAELEQLATTPTTAPGGNEGTVTSITDGDTLRVDGQPVRLIGVDTPETRHPSKGVQCFGKEATAFLSDLLPVGTRVRLTLDVEKLDRYKRTLAYVHRLSDGLFVNLELARRGYAQALTIPPNVAHADTFHQAAADARKAGRGLWVACPQ